jgi:hypothetical protein
MKALKYMQLGNWNFDNLNDTALPVLQTKTLSKQISMSACYTYEYAGLQSDYQQKHRERDKGSDGFKVTLWW